MNSQDTIDITCQACGVKFRLPRSTVGRTGKCKCGNVLVIGETKKDQPRKELEQLREGLRRLMEEDNSQLPEASPPSTTPPKPPTPSPTPPISKPNLRPPNPSPTEEVLDVELVEPVAPRPRRPAKKAEPDLFSAALDSLPASPTPAPLANNSAAPSGFSGFSSYAAIDRCTQHPQVAAVHHCSICRSPVCRTCVFVFPPNITCCPKCVTESEVRLSPHRKWMIHIALGLAIVGSLVLALILSGLLSPIADFPFAGLAFEAIIALFFCTGAGLAFGSLNNDEGNPATIWIAGVWNILCLLGWLFLLLRFSLVTDTGI